MIRDNVKTKGKLTPAPTGRARPLHCDVTGPTKRPLGACHSRCDRRCCKAPYVQVFQERREFSVQSPAQGAKLPSVPSQTRGRVHGLPPRAQVALRGPQCCPRPPQDAPPVLGDRPTFVSPLRFHVREAGAPAVFPLESSPLTRGTAAGRLVLKLGGNEPPHPPSCLPPTTHNIAAADKDPPSRITSHSPPTATRKTQGARGPASLFRDTMEPKVQAAKDQVPGLLRL